MTRDTARADCSTGRLFHTFAAPRLIATGACALLFVAHAHLGALATVAALATVVAILNIVEIRLLPKTLWSDGPHDRLPG